VGLGVPESTLHPHPHPHPWKAGEAEEADALGVEAARLVVALVEDGVFWEEGVHTSHPH
jgi:hypothetical protein